MTNFDFNSSKPNVTTVASGDRLPLGDLSGTYTFSWLTAGNMFSNPLPIGDVTPNTGSFTDLDATSLSFDGGTTNQTVFLKGSLIFNAGTVAANSTTSTTTTITGALTVGQTAQVNCNAPIAGLIYTALITATNTVTLYITNPTGTGIGGANRTYSFTIIG